MERGSEGENCQNTGNITDNDAHDYSHQWRFCWSLPIIYFIYLFFFPIKLRTDAVSILALLVPRSAAAPCLAPSLPRRREDGNCNFISSGSGQAGRGNPARSNGLGQRERGRLVLEGEQSGYVGQL